MLTNFEIDTEISHRISKNTKNPDVIFTGDLSLKHEYWNQKPFSESVREYIKSSEYAVANLEGAINAGDPIAKRGPNLSVKKSTIKALADGGFNAVSLANNHAMDYGTEGLRSTQSSIQDANLESFGAGSNLRAAINPVTITCGNTSVGIFGLSENEEATADKTTTGVAWAFEPNIGPLLQKRIEDHDISILVAHGGLEYIPIPPRSWRAFLRSCTELGFDLILGHHPHTPQGWEWYNGKPIFYSLGNFAMYQPDRPSTHWSYVLEAKLDDRNLTGIRVLPTEAVDGQIQTPRSGRIEEYQSYLRDSSRIISNENYDPYWQTVAISLFNRIYSRQLRRYGVGHLVGLITDPAKELDRISRSFANKSVPNPDMAMKEYIQNPSHRDAIRTTLAVENGVEQDQRTEAVEETLQELFEQIEQRCDTARKNVWRLKVFLHRLSEAILN